MSFFHRHRGLTPYLLLAPGVLWLAVFFVVPLGFLAYQSLESGNIDVGYAFTSAWGNYWNAIRDYRDQFIRSLEYAGIATLLALVISYPVAYWIAFRGGRWKNLLLLFIVAPFFVTYLIRTLAWETILSDHGFVVRTLQTLHILGSSGRLLATGTAVVAGTLLTFIPAAGDFINAQLLGSPDNHMIGNVIQSKFLELTDYPAAAAMSFILMAGILVAVAVYARIVGTEQLTGTAV